MGVLCTSEPLVMGQAGTLTQGKAGCVLLSFYYKNGDILIFAQNSSLKLLTAVAYVR